MKNRSRLAVKMAMGVLILGILICAVSSLIGYHQYKTTIEKQYNTTAYQLAEVAASYIDEGTFKEYVALVNRYFEGTVDGNKIKEVAQTPKYRRIKTQIEQLRESSQANDILVFVVDEDVLMSYSGTREGWEPLHYIFDSYTNPQLSYTLGDKSSFNPEFINELSGICRTGQRSSSYFISKGDYGYNTAGIHPVLTDDGKVLALVSVEIPMVTLQTALKQYIVYAILVTVALIIMFIISYVIYLYRHVVKPINVIAEGARAFTESEQSTAEVMSSIKTGDEIQYLAESFVAMEQDINRYIENLTAVTAEKERIGAELDIAKNIQQSMLPRIFPAFPERDEFDLYASMDPAKEVGGDFYDFFFVDHDHLAVVMADVSGKGVPAALFMMISKTLLKSAAQAGLTPAEVLAKVNDQLCENNDAQMFVTVWIGIIDVNTGRMVCANAGHEYPAIMHKDTGFELFKDPHGFVLAGMEGMAYKEYEIELMPGDRFFVYTDGVAEATDASSELYGTDRMIAALNKNIGADCRGLIESVREDVDAFVGEAPQFDDITMFCMEYKGSGGAEA